MSFSSQQRQKQIQESNLEEQAIKALSLLDMDEQKLVLEYISTLVDSKDNEREN